MNTIGIIAEYNPFHNGHKYQIQKAREQTAAKHVVIVMSGDFVQRGTPAWTDKYLRTQMALACGADLVFELPVYFSCASAETFATAGVSLFTSLGFVDGICFGAECKNLSTLYAVAECLSQPSEYLERQIKMLVSSGQSYPAAREQALKNCYPNLFFQEPDFLSSPNNILAIEYLKAIQKMSSPLIPHLIPRTDAGYHETIPNKHSPFLSATAIRLLAEKNNPSFPASAAPYLPKEVISLLSEHPFRYGISEDDFSELLYYRLLTLSKKDEQILDMNPELYQRIQKYKNHMTSFSSFSEMIKTRQYTRSRIHRVLLHLLLNIEKSLPPSVPYARLLGFRKEKSFLLRKIQEIPMITKPADGKKQLSFSATAEHLYEKDLFAANLYTMIQNRTLKSLPNEFVQKPIIWTNP